MPGFVRRLSWSGGVMMADHFDTLLSSGQGELSDAEAATRPCVTEDEALAFAQGLLGGRQLRYLHAHADRCLACQQLLEEAVIGVEEEAPSGGESKTCDTIFAPKAVVSDRYRIIRFIARGGMGEVYEAHDGYLNERIALKTVVPTTCDSPRAVEYLRREVQLAHRVSHPNVCRIFDLNAHVLEGTGKVVQFLTMEFVEGQVLGQHLLEHGPLPVDQAQELIRQLLLGLRAAHAAGILHRDFKSDNVILRVTRAGELQPVILDFGLARALDPNAKQLTSATHHGLVGTLSYMAPEQIEGGPLSPASDLYALGVVWFELLTGQLPFRAESMVANALERLRKPPVIPSSIRAGVPKAVDAILLRCLSRRVEDRFQSADEILSALDSNSGRGRRRHAATFVLVALGGLVSLLAVWAWLAGPWLATFRAATTNASTSSPAPLASLIAKGMPTPPADRAPSPAMPTSMAPSPAMPTSIAPSPAMPTSIAPSPAMPTSMAPSPAMPTSIAPMATRQSSGAPSAFPTAPKPTGRVEVAGGSTHPNEAPSALSSSTASVSRRLDPRNWENPFRGRPTSSAPKLPSSQ